MHAAPPVSVVCAAGWRWRGIQLAVLAGAVAAATCALLLHLEWAAGRIVGVLALACPVAAALAWRLVPSANGELRWNAPLWQVTVPSGLTLNLTTVPQVRFDLGDWLWLYCADAPLRWRWLAVDAQANPANWPLFRAALYSSAPSSAPVHESAPTPE